MVKYVLFCMVLLILCSVLLTTSVFAQSITPFNANSLVKLGDEIRYGSYLVRKIGDKAYQINDPGDKTTKGGGWGVDMYLVCGSKMALLIDLGNNYIDGYEKDLVKPLSIAGEELLAVVYGLAGKVPVKIAVTHMQPDHDGMFLAFIKRKVNFWAGEGEDLMATKTQFKME